MKKNVFKIIVIVSIFLASCKESNLVIDTSSSQIQVDFRHYEQALFNVDQNNIGATLDQWSKEFPVFVNGNYKDPANIFTLQKYLNNELNIKLWEDWQTKIGSYDEIETDLNSAFSHYKHYYPNDSIPPLYTYISGINYEEPIIISREGIILGIDMYYGADYLPYKKLQIPTFISKNNKKEFIAPILMREYAKQKFGRFIFGETMLDNMIGLGKVEYFVEAMMPEMQDSARFQFTPKQMKWCYSHEEAFWKHLSMKDLLFNKDEQTYKKYLQPGPFVSSLERDSPGRAGIYIGYKIVKDYMDRNSDVSLNQLMVDTDFKGIFSAAKYKP